MEGIIMRMVALLSSIHLVELMDVCQEPIGMENWIIHDSKIRTDPHINLTNQIRLNDDMECSTNLRSVQIDLGRLMTITGFAYTSNVQTNATLRYGVNSSNLDNFYNVVKSGYSANQTEMIEYPILETTETKRFNFPSFDLITLRYIRFHFEIAACVKLEIYGCAEACSSIIKSTVEKRKGNLLEISSRKSPFTVTGIMVPISKRASFINIFNFVNFGSLTMICIKGANRKTVKVITITRLQRTTIWLDENVVCDRVEVYNFERVSIIGCSSECTGKLFDRTTTELTVSSYYSPFHIQARVFSLNNIQNSWAARDGSDASKQWIQACFTHTILVSAIALKGQGHWSAKMINSFVLAYKYGPSGFIDYEDERLVGATSRYGTSIRKLPTPITAQCIRLKNFECRTGTHCAGRWDLLGCTKGLRPEIIAVTKSPAFVTKNGRLECNANGQPRMTIQWMVQNKPIRHSDVYTVIKSQTFSASPFNISYKLTLEITGIPDEVQNRYANCSMDTNSSNEHCHLEYTCRAFYLADEYVEKKTTVLFKFNRTVDDPIIRIVTVNSFSATLTWQPLSAAIGNSQVTGYRLLLIDSGTNQKHYERDTSNQTYRFTDLKPYRNYTLQLQAYNLYGVESKWVNETIETKQAAPSTVNNLNVVPTSDRELRVSWDPPLESNGVLSQYVVAYGRPSYLTGKIETSDLFVKITDLEPDTEYLVLVQATTDNGMLQSEAISQTVKTKKGKPTSPKGITFIVNSTYIQITWLPPEKMNGDLRNYFVAVHGTKEYFPGFEDNRSYNTTKTSITILNKYPGTKYTVSVSAVTDAGEGNRTTKDFTTLNRKPEVPNVRLTNFLNEYHITSYVQPFTGPISYYEVGVSENISNSRQPDECFKNKVIINSTDFLNTIIIKKGIKDFQIGGNNMSLELIGKYVFCVRAVGEGNMVGDYDSVVIDRKDLGLSTWNAGYYNANIFIPQGPNTTMYYVVIVNRKIPSFENLPTYLQGYDENHPMIPYITAVFNDHRETFTVGDGAEYSLSNQEMNDSAGILHHYQSIKNVKLQSGCQYVVWIRAHEDEERYYSAWISLETKLDIEKTLSLPVIISVFFIVVITFVIITVAFLFIRRRQKKNELDGKETVVVKHNDVQSNKEKLENYEENIYESFVAVGNKKNKKMDEHTYTHVNKELLMNYQNFGADLDNSITKENLENQEKTSRNFEIGKDVNNQYCNTENDYQVTEIERKANSPILEIYEEVGADFSIDYQSLKKESQLHSE